MAADSSIRAKEFRIKVAESGNVLEIQGEGGLDCTQEFLDAFNAGESTALTAAVNAAIASEVTNRNAAIAAQHTTDNATYAAQDDGEIGNLAGQGVTAQQIARLVSRVNALESAAAGRWPYKRSITVDNSLGGPSKTTAWQVRIDLTSSNMTFTHARRDGLDIAFRLSDGTLAPSWIESYDYTAQTATIWVRVPPLATSSITVTMLYGNPGYTAPWKITDVFPAGIEWTDLQDSWSFPTLGNYVNLFTQDEAWETTSAAHTVDIVDFGTPGKLAPNGQTYRFWLWYGHYQTDGIGLAWSNSPTGPWTKYASNPILNSAAVVRWPAVELDDAGTLHMIVECRVGGVYTLERYTLSADGITATHVETVASVSGDRCGGPFLFRDPVSRDYILYFGLLGTGLTERLVYKRAKTIPELTGAPIVEMSSSPLIWAAPAMLYFDGLYWLMMEDFDSAGSHWRTIVCSSPSPVGPFTPCSNSVLLSADEPCARAFVFDGVLYTYMAKDTTGSWLLGYRSGAPRKGAQATSPVLSAPPYLHGHNGTALPSVLVDTSAAVAGKSNLVAEMLGQVRTDLWIVTGGTTPANMALVARVKPLVSCVRLGFRGGIDGGRYAAYFDATSAVLQERGTWNGSYANSTSAGHALGFGTGTWRRIEVTAVGTALAMTINGTQVVTKTSATYASGGYISAEANDTACSYRLHYMFARCYDGTDPTITVGAEAAA